MQLQGDELSALPITHIRMSQVHNLSTMCTYHNSGILQAPSTIYWLTTNVHSILKQLLKIHLFCAWNHSAIWQFLFLKMPFKNHLTQNNYFMAIFHVHLPWPPTMSMCLWQLLSLTDLTPADSNKVSKATKNTKIYSVPNSLHRMHNSLSLSSLKSMKTKPGKGKSA